MLSDRKSSWRASLLGLALPLAFAIPVLAAEPVPGDACSSDGAYLQSGGPEVAGGGHFLVCDDSEWKSVLDYSVTTGRVDVDIANDTSSCTAAKTGRLRYDDANDEWEYCDGSDPWKPLGTGGSSAASDCTNDSSVLCTLDATRSNNDPQFTAANIKDGINILGVTGTLASTASGIATFNGPTDCPEIGNECDNGSFYAGVHPTLKEWLFVHPSDQSTSASAWSTVSQNNTSARDSNDGRSNQTWIVANRTLTSYPAFKQCDDLNQASALGQSDWYLPAANELLTLRARQTALNVGLSDDLDGNYYWSSTEVTNTLAVQPLLGANPYSDAQTKTYAFVSVRCIRREAPPEATACVPNPLCPDVGDVCDDGDAGTTNDPIFIGFMLYNDANSADVGQCKALYVSDSNQSTASLWKTSRGVTDIATSSDEDGKLNDAQIPDSATFPAFKLCKDLSHGGFTDWYLPARSELDLIWLNRTHLAPISGGYFSSSESTADYARALGNAGVGYSGGQDNMYYKNVNMRVRCVRRD